MVGQIGRRCIIHVIYGIQGKIILTSNCCSNIIFRFPDSWTQEPSLNIKRAFGYFAFLPDTMCKNRKLFIFGGLDPTTSKPVIETETFDEDEGIWTIHKSLPNIKGHVFQNGADSGCLKNLDGNLYSVGKDIVSVKWRTLKVHIVTKVKDTAYGEGCVFLSLENDDFGFFFLSGDWFSLKFLKWSAFDKPDPAFNIVALKNTPTVLGMAYLNEDCLSPNCKGKTLYGDKKVYQLDVGENQWNIVGNLKYARLGYTSAVEVPRLVCDIIEHSVNVSTNELKTSLQSMSRRIDKTEDVIISKNPAEPESFSDFDFESNATNKDIIFKKSLPSL